MNTIEKVRTKLASYPAVRYAATPDSITVEPAEEHGFTVQLRVAASGFTVSFDGWHEEFSSEDEALDCFAFGLSTACRLTVVYRGTTPVKWTVESRDRGEWRPDSSTGLLLQPFWRPPIIVHRQNRVIVAD